jgi:hypothetical protein
MMNERGDSCLSVTIVLAVLAAGLSACSGAGSACSIVPGSAGMGNIWFV